MLNYYTHRKSSAVLLFVLSICSMAWTSPAASREVAHTPPALLNAIKAVGIPSSAVSIHVQAVESTKTLLSMNAQAIVQPASLMKLITTAAALDLLGPDYRWTTRVYTNGAQQGDVLQGDLIIRGSGDPRFSQQDLWQLLRRLRALGIRQITGDVILDRSLFAPYKDDAAQFDQKPERAYNA
jgi:D-alanyl-D-alanine carboxypeptidase/D-alanyl-D-alanine-endopeptidase (penicillin-binding protein 4)